jgi:transposase
MLQRIRAVQSTPEWKRRYERRAGIKGTLSQGTRAFGLRRSRSVGEASTHLQHILTANAISHVRFAHWKAEVPHARTRTSCFVL